MAKSTEQRYKVTSGKPVAPAPRSVQKEITPGKFKTYHVQTPTPAGPVRRVNEGHKD
jgi:hypothetical protein